MGIKTIDLHEPIAEVQATRHAKYNYFHHKWPLWDYMKKHYRVCLQNIYSTHIPKKQKVDERAR